MIMSLNCSCNSTWPAGPWIMVSLVYRTIMPVVYCPPYLIKIFQIQFPRLSAIAVHGRMGTMRTDFEFCRWLENRPPSEVSFTRRRSRYVLQTAWNRKKLSFHKNIIVTAHKNNKTKRKHKPKQKLQVFPILV